MKPWAEAATEYVRHCVRKCKPAPGEELPNFIFIAPENVEAAEAMGFEVVWVRREERPDEEIPMIAGVNP